MMFSDLTEREMAIVEKLGMAKSFIKNAHIVREGEEGSAFYLILGGKVEVRKGLKRGPLEMFGEGCFLGELKRSASVVVLEDCQVLEFRRDEFKMLMRRMPEIGMKVYAAMAQELARRLAITDEALRDAIVWSMGTRAGGTKPGA